jgi:uncharacterized membrane protein YsdA (DUF1294 family)/cold shock CspA family protein
MGPMRKSGELVQWNDVRGFGFVRDADGTRLFVHISDIRRAVMRPEVGLRVTFLPGSDRQGRAVAKSVVLGGVETKPARPAKTQQPGPAGSTAAIARLLVAGLLIAGAIVAMLLGRVSAIVPAGYLALGVASIVAYWFDKAAAEGDRWRVSEKRLHFVDAIGGIAGGLLAQALLQHKTRKSSFAAVSWTIAAVHAIVLALLIVEPWRFTT